MKNSLIQIFINASIPSISTNPKLNLKTKTTDELNLLATYCHYTAQIEDYECKM